MSQHATVQRHRRAYELLFSLADADTRRQRIVSSVSYYYKKTYGPPALQFAPWPSPVASARVSRAGRVRLPDGAAWPKRSCAPPLDSLSRFRRSLPLRALLLGRVRRQQL